MAEWPVTATHVAYTYPARCDCCSNCFHKPDCLLKATNEKKNNHFAPTGSSRCLGLRPMVNGISDTETLWYTTAQQSELL